MNRGKDDEQGNFTTITVNVGLEDLLRTLTLVAVIGPLLATMSEAAPYATDWVKGHNSSTRLIVGGALAPNGRMQRYAALEIKLPEGWKTYWRQPGSSGGVPPYLNWSGSQNLKSATLKFPAPIRMLDPTGETIGYKRRVVFPIAIEPEDTSRTVVLSLKASFGICREICIPAQAAFKVTLNNSLFRQTPPELAGALSLLPVDTKSDGKPRLEAVAHKGLEGGKHVMTFDVRFPPNATDMDLFAETGAYQPLAMSDVVTAPSSGITRYRVTVTQPSKWKQLAKDGLMITMVSSKGSSEARIPRP